MILTRRILPVVHISDPAQAVEQSHIAVDVGADGIFLIDHSGDLARLGEAAHAVRDALPESWIGLNFLGFTLPDAVREAARLGVDAVWSDSSGLDERKEVSDQPAGALLRKAVSDSGFAGEVFGGVAFKYQRPVPDEDLTSAARVGSAWLDVVTTSGPGTGSAAPLSKLAALRSGMSDGKRLAVASGVTPDTVADVLTYVDDVLVASSVCADFHHFDARLLEALVRRAR